MLDTDYKKRFEGLVKLLAGSVFIRWQPPATPGAIAAVKRIGSCPVMDIHPDLMQDLDNAYDVILHECAHVILGHYKYTKPGNFALRPYSLPRPPADRPYKDIELPFEKQAEKMAKEIDFIAAFLAKTRLHGSSVFHKIAAIELYSDLIKQEVKK